MAATNPLDFGAIGDGLADDSVALKAAIDALPAGGGIVYFPSGKSFKSTNVLTIQKSHVKLWATNREAEIFQSIAGQKRRQAILWSKATGCGLFGLKLRSDASARFDALEDSQVAFDSSTLLEVVGNEIEGSASAAVFVFGSSEAYIEGNYIHHSWADHIHHTAGSSASWVWGNTMFSDPPSKGDDGIACVTYGPSSKRCSDMEWWNNAILGTDGGRGYSVIGGNDIDIHDNWAIKVGGAGIIVASEPSFDTAASQDISISRNFVVGCGHAIGGHPGILISGLYPTAGPLKDIHLNDNISVGSPGGPFRAEGDYENAVNERMITAKSALPEMPRAPSFADTRVLRTRDTSQVAPEARRGLYRIHVRRNSAGSGFEQRFEYTLKGDPDTLTTFVMSRVSAGDALVEQRTIGGVAYALLLTPAPLVVPSTVDFIRFRELREQDRDGTLSWLWARLDRPSY